VVSGEWSQDTTHSSPLTTHHPKITDFGLAKRLDQQIGQTQTGEVMGTPSYMAPEQAAGRVDEIGPTTDVYALGAMLYEFLTGRPPFSAASAWETVRQILNDEPIAPMHLQPGVPKDLETVCLKSLQKDRAARYESAQALADDLGRFLRGEPIKARPVGPCGRLHRWCRRNPRVAGLLAALVLVFVVGFTAVVWQWQKAQALRVEAQKERDEAEKNYQLARRLLADYFASLSKDPMLDSAGALPLRKALLETALRHFRSFLSEQAEDPHLQAELARAYYVLAVIARLSGAAGEEIPLLEKAVAIQEHLAGSGHETAPFQLDLARSFTQLGAAEGNLRREAQARRHLQQALQIEQRLAEADPDNPEVRQQLGRSYQVLGFLDHAAGDSAKALPLLEKARALRAQLIIEQPDNLVFQSDLSSCLNDLGLAQEVLARYEEALKTYQEAIRIAQPVLAQARQAVRYRNLLCVHYFNIGRVLCKLGRPTEAAEAAQKCTQLNPEDPDYLCFGARILAMAAYAVGAGKTTPSAAEQALRTSYADRAVRGLQEAANYGFSNWLLLASVPELQPLQSRPDFKKLLTDMQSKQARSGGAGQR
jgi:serine/threonine-protein kinase